MSGIYAHLGLDETSRQPAAPIDDTMATVEPSNVRVKNRRRRYLELNPDYFSSDLELAGNDLVSDPLLYDRLVRRFQSTSEREAEGKKKGYSGILEADLSRGEAKLAALQRPEAATMFSYRRGPNGEILAEEKDEVPATKEEGMARWRWEMEMRFIRGDDTDFDYTKVDGNEAYDDRDFEDRQAEDKYFDEEAPEFVEGPEGVRRTASKELTGETGITDY